MNKTLAKNHSGVDHEISRRFAAGMVLTGAEVKSLRSGMGSMVNGCVLFRADGCVVLTGLHIPVSKNEGKDIISRRNPDRDIPLLVSKKEKQMLSIAAREGLRVFALEVFAAKKHIKVSIATGIPLRKWDKRQKLKDRAESYE